MKTLRRFHYFFEQEVGCVATINVASGDLCSHYYGIGDWKFCAVIGNHGRACNCARTIGI